MERVLRGLYCKSPLVPLCDHHHRTMLLHSLWTKVFPGLKGVGLKLKPTRCEFLRPLVRYHGHIVSEDGVATAQVEATNEWRTPLNVKQLQPFLGSVTYCYQYVPEFATMAQPLHCLTRCNIFEPEEGGTRGLWSFQLTASIISIGAVLSQVQEGRVRVIACYSKPWKLMSSLVYLSMLCVLIL